MISRYSRSLPSVPDPFFIFSDGWKVTKAAGLVNVAKRMADVIPGPIGSRCRRFGGFMGRRMKRDEGAEGDWPLGEAGAAAEAGAR